MLGSSLTCFIGNGWTLAGTSWRVNWIGASNGGISGAAPRRCWLVFGFGAAAGAGVCCCASSAGATVSAAAKLRRLRFSALFCLLMAHLQALWIARVRARITSRGLLLQTLSSHSIVILHSL